LGISGGGRIQFATAPLGTDVASSALNYDEFKQAVLERQIANARASGRQYYPPVPASELDAVETGHRMRTEAARYCRALLAAARSALETAKAAQDPKAIRTSAIGVGSSYRDYDHDKGLWDRYYPDYYRATQADRDAAVSGPHGPAAVELLARYISPRKAAPGFSNHSNGTAVDFTTTVDGTLLTDKSARETWRETWLHAWLVINAGIHHFHALASEEWHWDYR
jgi:hypothetical protein